MTETHKTPQLSDEQIEQLDNLIEYTILQGLYEDGICTPDMSDVKDEDYDNVYQDRQEVLYGEALNYIKNNLH